MSAWKDKHYTASEEVAAKWIKDVQSVYGQSEKTKYACVGYWYVSILMHLSTCREEKKQKEKINID